MSVKLTKSPAELQSRNHGIELNADQSHNSLHSSNIFFPCAKGELNSLKGY